MDIDILVTPPMPFRRGFTVLYSYGVRGQDILADRTAVVRRVGTLIKEQAARDGWSEDVTYFRSVLAGWALGGWECALKAGADVDTLPVEPAPLSNDPAEQLRELLSDTLEFDARERAWYLDYIALYHQTMADCQSARRDWSALGEAYADRVANVEALMDRVAQNLVDTASSYTNKVNEGLMQHVPEYEQELARLGVTLPPPPADVVPWITWIVQQAKQAIDQTSADHLRLLDQLLTR